MKVSDFSNTAATINSSSNAFGRDSSITNWGSQYLIPLVLVATIARSTSISLPSTSSSSTSSSSVSMSTENSLSYSSLAEASITEFAVELNKRSRCLNSRETEMMEKMIFSKLKPGFPIF